MCNNYLYERFNRLLERVDARDLFDESDDSDLTVLLHTGQTFDSFRINVNFHNGNILITTHSCIGVEDRNAARVRNLLNSINNIEKYGKYFIGNNNSNVISYSIKTNFDELESLDNPFDLIFLGAESIMSHTEAILKTLLGATVYLLGSGVFSHPQPN